MESYFKQSKGRMIAAFRFLLSGLLLTISVFAFSQTNNIKTKTGVIRVSDTENQFVSGVRLRINYCSNEIIGITDNNGIYKYKILESDTCKKATISIRSVLYMPLDTVVDLSCSPNLQLILKASELDGIKVVGYKEISQKNAEKITFKFKAEGLQKSAKADIALKRVPNIIYNEGNGTFTLVGNQREAKVLVNSIEVSNEELSKINAKDIDKVELRFIGLNDDKYSGEINIILKKDLTSLYKGEIEIGTNLLAGGIRAFPSFTRRSKTIDCITWVSYINDRQISQYKINRDNKEFFSSERHNRLQQYGATHRMNMFFSPKWMTSMSYSFFGYKSPANMNWELNGVVQPEQKSKEAYYSHFANFVLRHDNSIHGRFFIKARFFNYKSINSSSPPISQYTGRMNEYTGDILYESDSLPLFNKHHNLAIGYKCIYRNSILTSSKKTYNSNVQQFYVKDNLSINDNCTLFVLLRNEWDGYKFEKTKPLRRFSFLPSASLNYTSRIGSLSVAYVRSIIRPSIDYLNPEIYYINEFNKIKGNTNLKSQYTDKYSFGYSKQIKDSYFTATVSFENIKNLIDMTYSNSYDTAIYNNIGKGKMLRLDIAYNKPFFSNALNINLNIGTGYATFKIDPKLLDNVLSRNNNGWYFISSANVSYLMPKDWFINFSMNYISKDITLNATTYKKATLNLLLTKSLFHDNLDFSLQYSDMFKLSDTWRIKHNFKGLNQISTFKIPSSMLIFSITYRFGRQFTNRNVGHSIKNEDIITK